MAHKADQPGPILKRKLAGTNGGAAAADYCQNPVVTLPDELGDCADHHLMLVRRQDMADSGIERAEKRRGIGRRVADLQQLREARNETRTRDPFLTMEVLYQLSYPGEGGLPATNAQAMLERRRPGCRRGLSPSCRGRPSPLPRARCRARGGAPTVPAGDPRAAPHRPPRRGGRSGRPSRPGGRSAPRG